MNQILQSYVTLVEFLGKALSPQYEIVLHDLSADTYSIAAIANGHVSGRNVGAPLTGMALKFVIDKVYTDKDYEVNYCGKSKEGNNLRSSTMFIKDNTEKIIGMLCINYDQSKCESIVEDMLRLFQINSPISGNNPESVNPDAADSFETFPDSIADVVSSVLQSILHDSSIPRDRLTQEEKLQIVNVLNQRGVFLLTGLMQ